jgi:hypothetical protein
VASTVPTVSPWFEAVAWYASGTEGTMIS